MSQIKLDNDFTIDIATAGKRDEKKWKNRHTTWSWLLERCSETTRTGETAEEFARMSKDAQGRAKDVGGFVGGFLLNGTRKTASVLWRSLATFDIDHGTPDLWEIFMQKVGCAAMLYSTHKHTQGEPRYRLVLPLSRQAKPYEYEPLCRMVANEIGIDYFDDTTYQLARLFYYPSTSSDGDFVFKYKDGKALDVDEWLRKYKGDYRDVTGWPTSSREGELAKHLGKKAEDPTAKPGLIGAFCRVYTIQEAIDAFLGDVYEKTAHDNRYTYKLGSAVAGLVCYDDRFAYSNHETDPASGQLCNAFDLCRIHLFGVHDEGSKVTDTTRLPSYQKMLDFAAKDRRVRVLLTRERAACAKEDFAGMEAGGDGGKEEEDTGWMADLDFDKRGNIKATAGNIIAILENDTRLKGHVWHNLFNGFIYVSGGLPWNKEATQWGNTDDANLRIYLEEKYGVTGKDKIKDAFVAVTTRHRIHPIREYLGRLRWDGVPRLDRLIIDYVGAEDSELNRAMTRKHFAAAVARVMNPGCKYDYCLIVAGAEGIGKSTLFNVMGGDWFSDSLVTMEGTRGMEQARNGWVIELPELGGIKRSDVEQVKAYISRQNDMYRPAYGSVMEAHPRQCIFCGTTNETYFLKGETGNRRFWVIEADAKYRRHDDFRAALQADRDQLWAEAVQRYRDGEELCLPRTLEMEMRQRQAEHNDNGDDPLPGMVQAYVDMKLPPDWDTWDLNRRRAYINNPDPLDETGTETRTRVCAAEFLSETLGRNIGSEGYKYEARKVNKILEDLGWQKRPTLTFPIYGKQRAFVRPEGDDGDTI